MKIERSHLAAGVLAVAAIYLFASAPPRLPEADETRDVAIPVAAAFTIFEHENDVVRALYAAEIVGAGSHAGLHFSEHWEHSDVEAGPLPALFLRETAENLELGPTQLRLLLGSASPIEPSNRFRGQQLEHFAALQETGEPQFFHDAQTGRSYAMFADVAATQACVDCHNSHQRSPKRDWQLGDVMGATTWTYPSDRLSLAELTAVLAALRGSFEQAYATYLEKAEGFAEPASIGERWPREGYGSLPSLEVFLAEFDRRASPQTLASIIATVDIDRPTGPLLGQGGLEGP